MNINISCSFLLSVLQVRSGETEHEVGKISKQWSGYVKEMFTTADNFGITFPMDLDVKMKACMIGALFLIVRPILYIKYMTYKLANFYLPISSSSPG